MSSIYVNHPPPPPEDKKKKLKQPNNTLEKTNNTLEQPYKYTIMCEVCGLREAEINLEFKFGSHRECYICWND